MFNRTVCIVVFSLLISACADPYRKRIVATGFPLVNQSQVIGDETQDLYSGIPREINNRLNESSDFIGINATKVNLYPRADLAPDSEDRMAGRPSNVMQIAASNRAQFVLSGVIRDLGVESGEYMTGEGPLAYVNNLISNVMASRGIEIDVYVHDGFTGALLFQQRYADDVMGDVWIPATYTVGSERFNSTSTGEKINQIIDQASTDIRESLGRYPLVTRIIEIKGDDEVFIDAGEQENLGIGDELDVYSATGDHFNLDAGISFMGKDREPSGSLTIRNVTSRYAIGSLEDSASELGVKVGDWVKSR